MNKIRRYLITVDTDLCGTQEKYYAEDIRNLEENSDFLDLCEMLAYDNYQSYTYNYEDGEELELDPESYEYYYFIKEISDEEYEEDKEYYNELENIWQMKLDL